MKQQIISEVGRQLSAMNLPLQYTNGTDITIITEFLDTGWSTGEKKISYESLIFADERNTTIYMYEKTTEIGHGFSFGSSSDSSFQSGATLYRKVKSIQYGPDGKAYEYTLDLGSIPKTVKQIAENYGWSFKTVIKKEKASYPEGYIPIPIQSGNPSPPGHPSSSIPIPPPLQSAQFQTTPPLQAAPLPNQYQSSIPPNRVQPGKNKKGGVFGLIGFLLLGLILIFTLFAADATAIGWVISIVIYAVAFLFQRLLKKRGCLLHLILWLITGFLLLIVMTMFTAGDLDFTSANIKNAHMTTKMDENGKPVDEIETYSPNASELVAVAELHNAPPQTQIRFLWTYVTENITISEYPVNSGENDSNIYIFSNLTNDRPWPEGEYKVEIFIDERQTPDSVIEFKISNDMNNSESTSSAETSKVVLPLPYEKSFPLEDGKSTGTFRLYVSDGTGFYENYKGEVICEFLVSFATETLPEDFILAPEQATENDASGFPCYDQLQMAICSDTEAYHQSALSSGDWIYNDGDFRPYVETDAGTTNVDADTILEFANSYPYMQILRYNANEVGMTQVDNAWSMNYEKAFGLHPPITQALIPWDEILYDLGLK